MKGFIVAIRVKFFPSGQCVERFRSAGEALHEAFKAVLKQWFDAGVPGNPRVWLVSDGRYKGIDNSRLRHRFEVLPDDIEDQLNLEPIYDFEDKNIEDNRLRLIFTCCHPILPQGAQIALTLREVCGLTTEAIASAFLVSTPWQRGGNFSIK